MSDENIDAELLSDSDRDEIVCLSEIGISEPEPAQGVSGRSPQFPDGIPALPPDWEERYQRERLISDTDGVRAGLEARVLKPGVHVLAGRQSKLPAWASEEWRQLAADADLADGTLSDLQREEAALPGRLEQAIDKLDADAVTAIQSRRKTIKDELFQAKCSALQAHAVLYDCASKSYAEYRTVADAVFVEKRAAVDAAAAEARDAEDTLYSLAHGMRDNRSYATSARNELERLIATEKRRLMNSVIVGPRTIGTRRIF